MHRIAILISGRGSNMLALADAVRDGRIPDAEVAVVISDQRNAPGLVSAEERGLKTIVIERMGRPRSDHDLEIMSALRAEDVELICLAGYMRVLSSEFIDAFRGRILNIHPSLLPSFPGLDVHARTIASGVKFSGCTVHIVDETLDGGPIVAQAVVPVEDDDTPETLAARILKEEHRIYAEGVKLLLSREYKISGQASWEA